MNELKLANKIFLENFKPETRFERAIFLSWYCSIRDCSFCYMSTQADNKKAVRSTASILAEIIICKNLGWDIGFISSGIGAYKLIDLKNLLKKINLISKEKVWLNVGPLSLEELKEYKPYIKGVVGSIECINEKIHDKVCPSKQIKLYVEMFRNAKKLGSKNAMTIILGLGESINDFKVLKEFIINNKIDKIHFYSLNPQKGTIFENDKPIKANYQASWIAKTRINFPKIDIQCGIWKDKVDRVALLLNAGANSISKFPSIKYFNSKEAKIIEKKAREAKRKFKGSLTRMPKIKVNLDNIDSNLKNETNIKLKQYIDIMKKR